MSLLEIQQDMAVLLSRAADASESLSNIEDRQIRTPSPDANLLQQLADMKTMMESMRMEKMQQENKHKAEQEARELTEIQTTLLSAAIPPYMKAHFLSAIPAGGDASDKLIKHIQASERILYIAYNQNYVHVKATHGGKIDVRHIVRLIITNQHVYSIRIHSDALGVAQGGENFLQSGLHYMPLYTFDKPLQLKQIKLLSILTQHTPYHQAELQSTHPTILGAAFPNTLNAAASAAYLHQAQKKFESVIRLIPGSYQNGDWRPMDGFFGLYFNETTMEVNEFPGRTL